LVRAVTELAVPVIAPGIEVAVLGECKGVIGSGCDMSNAFGCQPLHHCRVQAQAGGPL
jgi:hypothetical protein